MDIGFILELTNFEKEKPNCQELIKYVHENLLKYYFVECEGNYFKELFTFDLNATYSNLIDYITDYKLLHDIDLLIKRENNGFQEKGNVSRKELLSLIIKKAKLIIVKMCMGSIKKGNEVDFLKIIFSLNVFFPDSFKDSVKQGVTEKKIVEVVSKIDFNGVKALQKRSLFDLNCITLENFIQIVKSFLKTSENFSQFSELFKILTLNDNKFKVLPQQYKKNVIMVLLKKYYDEVKKSKTIEDISIDMFDKFLIIISWINSESNIREDMYKLIEILRNTNLSIDCLILLYEYYFNIPSEKKRKISDNF